MGQTPLEPQAIDPNTRKHKYRPYCICGQQNLRVSARDNTGQHKGHIPSPKNEIEIPDPTGIEQGSRV